MIMGLNSELPLSANKYAISIDGIGRQLLGIIYASAGANPSSGGGRPVVQGTDVRRGALRLGHLTTCCTHDSSLNGDPCHRWVFGYRLLSPHRMQQAFSGGSLRSCCLLIQKHSCLFLYTPCRRTGMTARHHVPLRSPVSGQQP